MTAELKDMLISLQSLHCDVRPCGIVCCQLITYCCIFSRLAHVLYGSLANFLAPQANLGGLSARLRSDVTKHLRAGVDSCRREAERDTRSLCEPLGASQAVCLDELVLLVPVACHLLPL